MNNNQKINFIKTSLCNDELSSALDKILKEENKRLFLIKIIINSLNDELICKKIIENNSIKTSNIKIFMYSKILSVLNFYNKNSVIKSLLKSLDEQTLSKLAIYEYTNKTTVSIENKIFNKYCISYKVQSINNTYETLDYTRKINTSDLRNEKKNKKKLLLIPVFCILGIIIYFGLSFNNEISKYKDKFYPNIYLNNINLINKKLTKLDALLNEEKQSILSQTITISNVNEKYKFSFEDLKIGIDITKTSDEINNYIKNLSYFDKLKLIKNKDKKVFYLKADINDSDIDSMISLLEEKLNTSPRNDAIIIDENYNLYYDKGINGFILDKDSTKQILKEAFSNLKEETVIEAKGKTIKNEVKYSHLSNINKKISSFTTYFLNSGNRGHNITLAASKLNGTVLMPGEEFSYLKVVGPYSYANGYRPAPIYLNGVSSTANGGGVCQLATTIYNAQLRAGLQTVIRRNHSIAPNYVPKGLDATVYSTTTNYKFKNQYEYPVYIVSYIKGNYLTVDMWSNENALGGKTFEPYAVYSNGGYLAYLKIIENGQVIETKYLDKSYYKK